MNSNTLLILLGLMTLFCTFCKTNGMKILPCRHCATQEECDLPPPMLCAFGEGRDDCGRRICHKGPGQKCGGKFNFMGICGEGLMCNAVINRCYGCYVQTMACWPFHRD